MTLLEACSYLFFDSYIAMLILPLQNNFVFEVMKVFGTYNPYLISAIAALGATVAAMTNWVLGKLIDKALNIEPESDRATALMKFLKEKEAFILALSFIPYAGSVITTAYGAIGGRFKMILPVVFLANFIFFNIYYILP